MHFNNSLTTFYKSFLLEVADVKFSVWWNHTRLNISDAVMRCVDIGPLAKVPRKGALSVPQNNQTFYAQLTPAKNDQKKIARQKLLNNKLKKTHWKSIKLIISEILDLVKSISNVTIFKPRKRDFSLADLELIQNLLEKNKGNFPKAWSQFYKITGTNQDTFNS